jgi:hypothetical protein
MHEHGGDLDKLLWFAGWLVAAVALFAAALRIPLQSRYHRWRGWLYSGGVVIAGLGVAVLANIAALLHDAHIDLTREKVYSPSAAAMRAVDQLSQPVTLTYFYRSQDPVGRRTRDLLQVMGRRNPLLKVNAVDPDKEPTLARTQGIKFYNAAVIEAEGRRVLVQSTDEAEIAIGIQRVLRQRVITTCFLEGHGELPMDSMEFHTHLEGVADHTHGEASSQVIETPGHGIGRLRRALEAQGYDARKLILATARAGVPADCTLLIAASPRTTFLPAESAALRAYLAAGGSALLLLDLGFVLEPELERLVAELGVRPEQQVVVDPLSHYLNDAEMVAVTGYDPHPVTRTLSLTFYPGVRPLTVLPATGRSVTPLLASSRDSYVRRVEPAQVRAVRVAQADGAPGGGAQVPEPGPRVLGAATEGRLDGSTEPFRAIVVGDGDFASNSFFPYMSNSDLLLAMVRWLAREERSTAVATRIPVPPLILLTGQQMRVVFILLVIVLPLAVVALGGVVWWRRR